MMQGELITYYYCVDIGGVQVNGYERLRISLFKRVVCINLGELCGHWRGAGEWGAVENCSQAASLMIPYDTIHICMHRGSCGPQA